MQSTWAFDFDHLIRCYNFPCALVQAFMLKEKRFCSNAYKQALTIENEKNESSYVSEASGHKKLCQWAQIGDQTRLTLSFGPKLSLAAHQPLCIFFVPNFKFHPLFQPNWGFSCPLSMALRRTLFWKKFPE